MRFLCSRSSAASLAPSKFVRRCIKGRAMFSAQPNKHAPVTTLPDRWTRSTSLDRHAAGLLNESSPAMSFQPDEQRAVDFAGPTAANARSLTRVTGNRQYVVLASSTSSADSTSNTVSAIRSRKGPVRCASLQGRGEADALQYRRRRRNRNPLPAMIDQHVRDRGFQHIAGKVEQRRGCRAARGRLPCRPDSSACGFDT